MGIPYALHIAGGIVGMIAGFIALYSAKGAKLHRRSGMLFVYGMLPMALFGALMAMTRNKSPETNIPAAALAFYLVLTGLNTVRPPSAGTRRLDLVMMLAMTSVAVMMLTLGLEALVNGNSRPGSPMISYFIFAGIGLLGPFGDLQVIRTGPRRGNARLARHLWRMCFALFFGVLSFTIQMARLTPKEYRSKWMMLPTLLVLATMLYWLWRVRRRQSLRGIVIASPAEAI